MNRIHRSMLLALCLLVVSLAAAPPASSLPTSLIQTVQVTGFGDTREDAIEDALDNLYASYYVFGDCRVVATYCGSSSNFFPPCSATVEARGFPKPLFGR